MRELQKFVDYKESNNKFFNLVNYHLAKRNFDTVKNILLNNGKIIKDGVLQQRVNKLFLVDKRASEWFGIAETIIGSITNMTFGGNVNVKVPHKKGQQLIDELYFDGYFIDSIKETYETALADLNGKAYLFFNTRQEYNNITQVKVRDEFIDFQVFPAFEIRKDKNKLVREFFLNVELGKDEIKTWRFEYEYITFSNGFTELNVYGYNEKENRLSDKEVVWALGIDTVHETFTFVPYIELNLRKGVIPNALFLENSLAQNLYFQDIDLSSSQTHVYLPEHSLYEIADFDFKASFRDRYETQHVLKHGGIDKETISVIPGKSAINEIERNLALNVIQACLDAKISPLSLGYSLIDKIASNTDTGVQKERVSIRLRENHINILKPFIAKVVELFLKLNNIRTNINNIAIIFDPYITPSVESMTNTLSKQVQFGIKSRLQAVKDLNKNELSDDEILEEYERIKELATQIDYNTEQRDQGKKATSNVLKSEK